MQFHRRWLGLLARKTHNLDGLGGPSYAPFFHPVPIGARIERPAGRSPAPPLGRVWRCIGRKRRVSCFQVRQLYRTRAIRTGHGTRPERI